MSAFYDKLWDFCLIPFSVDAFHSPLILVPLAALTFVFVLSLLCSLAGVHRG